MDVVHAGEGIPFVGNPYDLTFVRIKLYEPAPFPLLQFVEIFLEKGLTLFGADDSVDKESCSRRDDLWHIVYVDNEQQMFEDCSLWHS